MVVTTRRYRSMSRLWQVTTASAGIALLLGLFLQVTPAVAQQAEVATFEAGYFDRETGDLVAQDCLRFSLDGLFLFQSDFFASLGWPAGWWNLAGTAQGSVLSAFMSSIVTLDTGELVPVTASFGALVDDTGTNIEGVLVTTGGDSFPFLAVANPQCTVPAATMRQNQERLVPGN